MVITERFAWGHLPRTGGDATHALFRAVAQHHKLPFRIDHQLDHNKHDTFKKRGCTSLDLVLNIRRLPAIMLSCRTVFMLQGIYPDYRPMAVPSKEDFLDPASEYGRTEFDRLGVPGPLASIPDRYLEAFTDNGRLTISRWLRMENLREDFIDFIKGYYEVPQALVDRLSTMPTKEPLDYNHTIEEFFTPSDIATLYENNPRWRDVEIEVYGQTL